MSRYLLLNTLAVISLIVIAYIFIINKVMSTKKTIFEIVSLCLLAPTFISLGTFAHSDYRQAKVSNSESFYIASEKIRLEDFESAKQKADDMLLKDKGNIEAMKIKSIANALSGNYKEAEIDILSFKEANNLNSKQMQSIDDVLRIARVGQGIVDEEVESLVSLTKQEKDFGISEENKEKVINKFSSEIIENIIKENDSYKKNIERIDKIIEIEQALNENRNIGNIKKDVLDLVNKSINDIELKKLAVEVLIKDNDLKQASKIMKDIIKEENTLENKLLLSDIYINQIKQDTNSNRTPNIDIFGENNDSLYEEVESYEKEISDKKEELVNTNRKLSEESNENQILKLNNKVLELENQIKHLNNSLANVPTKKVINYVKAQKPIFNRVVPEYELQLSKLYYASGESEKAKKHLENALEVSTKSDSNSPIVNELQNLSGIYEQSLDIMQDERVAPTVNSVVENSNKGYFEVKNNNLNQEFRDFAISHIKYSKVGIYINRIDVSSYPEVTGYVSVGEESRGFFGRRSDFTKKDFILKDTGLNIDDFEVSRNTSNEVNVALVIDNSGSMNGQPMEDAKLAGSSFVRSIDSSYKTAVVSFNQSAYVESNLTSNKESLIDTINSIEVGGGTNISGGLSTSLSLLKDAKGNNSIILLSDGKDGNTNSIDDVIDLAKSYGVSIFTIGFGNVDDSYLGNIATSTGGKYFKANSTAELKDIYSVLSRYITNNYIVNYTVKDNEDINHRNLFLELKDFESQGNKDYIVGLDQDKYLDDLTNHGRENKVDVLSHDDFILTGINHGSILGSDVKNEVYIEVTGFNIPKDIQIKFGNRVASDIEYIDSTIIKVKVPTDMVEGEYDVIGITPDGEISTLKDGLFIYKSGTLDSIKVGDLNIKANSIKKIDNTKYIARGNVQINNVLRVAGRLNIKALNAISEKEYAAGDIDSYSKMYMTFDNRRDSFIGRVLEGKEWIVADRGFNANTNVNRSSKTILKNMYGNSLDIIVFSLELGTLNIVPDGLEFTLLKFAFNDLDGEYSKNKGYENIVDKATSHGTYFPVSGEASFKVTDKDILTRLSIGLNLNNNPEIKIPYVTMIPVKQIAVELDTIGPSRKFEFYGECGLPFSRFPNFEFTYNAYENNLLLPNSFRVKLELGEHLAIPLIPPTRNVTLNSLGAGVDNMQPAVESGRLGDLAFIGMTDIGFNLNPVSLPVVGNVEVLSLSDIELYSKLNLRELSLNGNLNLLGIDLVEATAAYSRENNSHSFLINTKGEIGFDLILAEFSVNGEYLLSIDQSGLIVEGQVNGYYRRFTREVSGGGSLRLSLNRKATTFTVTLEHNNETNRLRIAMDNEASILNLNKKLSIDISTF